MYKLRLDPVILRFESANSTTVPRSEDKGTILNIPNLAVDANPLSSPSEEFVETGLGNEDSEVASSMSPFKVSDSSRFP